MFSISKEQEQLQLMRYQHHKKSKMKVIIVVVFVLLDIISHGQYKPEKIYINENEFFIRQQLDDSMLLSQNIDNDKKLIRTTIFKLHETKWVEVSYVTLIDGVLHSIKECDEYGNGFYKKYSETGYLIDFYEIKNNRNEGRRFTFYSNGILKEKGIYNQNIKNGEWVTYLENGDTSKIENYIVKELANLSLEKYTTEEFNEIEWDENVGSLKHGLFKYFEEGKRVRVIEYHEGKFIREIR